MELELFNQRLKDFNFKRSYWLKKMRALVSSSNIYFEELLGERFNWE